MASPKLSIRVKPGSALERVLKRRGPLSKTARMHELAALHEGNPHLDKGGKLA